MTFSVVIPIYNMEKYLGKCLDSLINQTFTDWEVIAVNDGSTDRSPEILNQYAEADVRIRAIHKENGGISSAVKVGLKVAKGDYIAFVDSDDYIEQNMLKKLNQYVQQGIDIVQFGMVREDENGSVIGYEKFPVQKLEGTERIVYEYFHTFRMPSLACRVFRKELFLDVKIPGRNIGIDEILTLQLFGNCRNMISIEDEFYHIYVRPGSVSRETYSVEKVDAIIEVQKFICDYMKYKFVDLAYCAQIKALKVFLTLYSDCGKGTFITERELLEAEIKALGKTMKADHGISHADMKLRMNMRLYKMSKKGYRYLKRILN